MKVNMSMKGKNGYNLSTNCIVMKLITFIYIIIQRPNNN